MPKEVTTCGPIYPFKAEVFHPLQNTFTKKALIRIFANANNNGLTEFGAILTIDGRLHLASDRFWEWVAAQKINRVPEYTDENPRLSIKEQMQVPKIKNCRPVANEVQP